MSNKIWLAMWKNNDIAFHQAHVNPLLQQFLPQLALSENAKILVPMCGKSLDISLLAEQGHQVMGVELSPVAIGEYFDARKVTPILKKVGRFTRWRHGKTEIWCGDIFDLTARDILGNAVLYDCAALTAFSPAQRPDYVQHFYERLPKNCRIVLVTTEMPDIVEPGAPLVVDSELSDLYEDRYGIELLFGHSRLKQDPEQPHGAPCAMEEKIYLLTRR